MHSAIVAVMVGAACSSAAASPHPLLHRPLRPRLRPPSIPSVAAALPRHPRPPAARADAEPAAGGRADARGAAGGLRRRPSPRPAAAPTPEPAAGEPAPTPEPAAGEPAAGEPAPTPEPGEPEPGEPAAGGVMPTSECEAMIARELQLVSESGTDEMKAGAARTTPADLVQQCQADPYPVAAADCIKAATSALEMYRKCYSIPFQGHELVVDRRFKAGDAANAEADPPAFTRNGDLIVVRGECGLLYQKVGTFTAAFWVCDGRTLGPFTLKADIDQAMAALSEESSAGHRMIMGIMANYPSGGTGRWRVCNSSGVCHTE
ncbi:MAG: hypothetical protein U1F43_19530 [Myxococcota bacterium]